MCSSCIEKRASLVASPQLRRAPHAEEKVTLDSFETVLLLGKGAFGRVMLAVKKDTRKRYAIKVLNKRMLVAVKQHHGAILENEVLRAQQRHPCIVTMHYAFRV